MTPTLTTSRWRHPATYVLLASRLALMVLLVSGAVGHEVFDHSDWLIVLAVNVGISAAHWQHQRRLAGLFEDTTPW